MSLAVTLLLYGFIAYRVGQGFFAFASIVAPFYKSYIDLAEGSESLLDRVYPFLAFVVLMFVMLKLTLF